MPIEIDDLGVRVIGNNFKGVRFYDDSRSLQAEIYLDEQNRLNIGSATLVTGGSTESGAPVALAQAAFLTLSAHADLQAERVFSAGDGLQAADAGVGATYTVSVDSSVVRTTRTLTAGAGLTGGGTLAADRTFDVGAGAGITVNANDVAVNTGATFTWTAAHTFQATVTARDLVPESTDTYDLGSSTKLWRKGWLSELDAVVFAENTISIVGGWLFVAMGQGTVEEDVDNSETQIDFGAGGNLAQNDFVLFRAAGAVEYMQIGTNVSGNTWNVTRNVDGSGANTWAQGTPYVNLGYDGDGRIELNASDTPRISILRQGTSYNAQTELVRIGDMNGAFGVVSELYGLGVGDYAGGNYLSYNTTAGLVIKSGSGGITFDSDSMHLVYGTSSVYGDIPGSYIDWGGESFVMSGYGTDVGGASTSSRFMNLHLEHPSWPLSIHHQEILIDVVDDTESASIKLEVDDDSGLSSIVTITADTIDLNGALDSISVTGTIEATGSIYSDTDLRPSGTTGRIYWKHYDLNAGATAQLCDVAIPYAFIAIAEYQNVGQVALFFVAGGTTVAFELSDPSGVWGAAAGAGTYNIYHNGTNYVLQNSHGSLNRKFRAMILSMSG